MTGISQSKCKNTELPSLFSRLRRPEISREQNAWKLLGNPFLKRLLRWKTFWRRPRALNARNTSNTKAEKMYREIIIGCCSTWLFFFEIMWDRSHLYIYIYMISYSIPLLKKRIASDLCNTLRERKCEDFIRLLTFPTFILWLKLFPPRSAFEIELNRRITSTRVSGCTHIR